MKRFIHIFTIFSLVFLLNLSVTAQMREAPDDPPGTPGTNDHAIGEGAPIGSGLIILLSLGAAYGGRKVYAIFKDDKEELES